MTSGNKLSRIIAVFLCAVLAFGIVAFASPRTEVQAASNYWFGTYSTGRDRCTIQIKFWGLKSGSKARVVFDIKKNEFHVRNKDAGVDIIETDNREGTLTVLITPKNDVEYKIEIRGTGLKAGSASVKSCSISNLSSKTTKKKTTKKKKSTPKKTTAAKKATKKTTAVKKKVTTTTTSAETQQTTSATTVLVAAAANPIDTTTETSAEPTEETTPQVALNHNEGKKRSFAWMWFVLILAAGGLTYLRIRKLKNDGKTGKELALDFIPGVGDLVYAISGSNTKYAPIASDAQHGYSYNPAVGKKELKALDEELERAERSAFKPAPTEEHTPVKRPKEFSVNHAAAFAAAAGTVAGDEDKQEMPVQARPAAPAPFKPAEGVTRAKSVDPNEVFKTEVSHTTDDIMSSAFKPSLGSRPTDKIVSSAFKPAAGSHTSEKIVSSAVKSSNSKFKPQAPAKVLQDSDAVRQARERAEAAREQQAMRAAMRTGRSVAEVKGEAKPAATGPVNRPSAFGTRRPAASDTAKSTFNPVAAPARTKTGSTNSNQLGSMLAGNSNGPARTPVWASRGAAAINPFKNSGEEEAPETADENKVMSSYGTAVSSSAIMQGDQHVTDTRFKAAKGQVLEGQRPAIADPSAHVAPTATQPVFGFKPIDPDSKND